VHESYDRQARTEKNNGDHMIKPFILKADCMFYAESIDNAFERLARHFKEVSLDDVDIHALFVSGKIEITSSIPIHDDVFQRMRIAEDDMLREKEKQNDQ
jgi:hypothetical protein